MMSRKLTGSVSSRATLTGLISGTAQLTGSLQIPSAVDVTPYGGPYEYTPTEQIQTVEIRNKTAFDDITIGPIPSNYGLITWNGVTLTVS